MRLIGQDGQPQAGSPQLLDEGVNLAVGAGVQERPGPVTSAG